MIETAAMPRLLVVCHPNDRFMTGSYILHAMLLEMKRTGLGMKVQRHWTERPPADLVIPHIDLTVWPDSLIEFLTHYPNVVNRRLADISKRSISEDLLRPGDEWRGPVIVKTDLNYGGIVDRRHEREGAKRGEANSMSAPTARVPQQIRPFYQGRYGVFDTIAAVPSGIWKDPNLIVERYHGERKGALYGLRQLFLVGDAYVMRQLWGPNPVVKGDNITERQWLEGPPPPDVLAVARARGVEFGKIEFTVVDGKAFVFDIARTPTGPTWVKTNPELIARLTRGLQPLLARPSDTRSMETTS